MGLFDSDSDRADQTDQLLNNQLKQGQSELEQKKEDLYRTRLDIIKGQGAQNWNPGKR